MAKVSTPRKVGAGIVLGIIMWISLFSCHAALRQPRGKYVIIYTRDHGYEKIPYDGYQCDVYELHMFQLFIELFTGALLCILTCILWTITIPDAAWWLGE